MKIFTILLTLNLIVQGLTVPQLLGSILSPSKQETQSQSGLLDSVLTTNLDVLGLANINVSTNSNDRISSSNNHKKNDNNNKKPIQNPHENVSTKPSTTESSRFSESTTESTRNCIQSITFSSSQKTCQGQLIFEETFQANQLNKQIWSKEIRIPSDYDDGDFISYQDLPENCYIKNKQLFIVPTLLENTNDYNETSVRNGVLNFDERCTAITTNYLSECSRTGQYSRILPPIVSSRIGTREKFSFRYGRIEIKAKLPKGDWLFPQLLLEPYSTRPYGDKGYASGQIRVAFNRGNDILDNKDDKQIDGFRLYGGVVVTVGEELRDKFLINTLHRQHLSDDFHIYAMIWTNESMTFELDGTVYGQINGGFSNHPDLRKLKQSEKWRNGDFMAPFDREFFISLGVSAGGISDFPDNIKNGGRGTPKPWINKDPKAELRFWNDRSNWYRTWNDENAGLKVDYIRVWAL